MEIDLEPLDRLRQEVVGILVQDSALSRESLQSQLSDKGFDREIQGLHSESVYTHAGFARPKTAEHCALVGWQEAWKRLENSVVRLENKARSE